MRPALFHRGYVGIAALAVCAGFVMLAVFGALATFGTEGGSLLSCVASSAGLICDTDGHGLDAGHEASAFRAVTSSALALYAAGIALAFMVAQRSSFGADGIMKRGFLSFAFSYDRQDAERPSSMRQIRWLSLFESSPGR
jgi:hypothetical protein